MLRFRHVDLRMPLRAYAASAFHYLMPLRFRHTPLLATMPRSPPPYAIAIFAAAIAVPLDDAMLRHVAAALRRCCHSTPAVSL